ncbi:hypothetical protein [Pseudanabaena sp. FACHB-2040]|uniref:hypothetical protein n=1 Tax=Pseudanabaena sp. FACHB-2040 TaxID=2692859 RepID=UPI0018EFB585|nr:hypothetical protein [Pseudanabaena sp. FACHB-2040]
MTRRWLQASGAEFWLPLPLVAIAFWFSSSFLAAQELNRPQPTENKLKADTQLEIIVSVNILLINAVVNRSQGITHVKVETAEPVLKRLELELPLTDIDQIEATLAEELGIDRREVRQWVRYQILD